MARDATLQVGIGGIPNAVVELLAKAGEGAHGVHSEMFTTGLMRLHEAGRVRNAKGLFDGVSIATFAMGSRALYDWLDGNEAVRFLPVDVVNDPAVIARNRRIDSLRREDSSVTYGVVPPDGMDEAAPQSEVVSAREDDSRMRQAIAALPQDQQEVIRRSFFEEEPHSAIAAALQIPLGTVKSRLRIAFAKLRSQLENYR